MSFVILTKHLLLYSNLDYSTYLSLCFQCNIKFYFQLGKKLNYFHVHLFQVINSIYILLSLLGRHSFIYLKLFLIVLSFNSVVILEIWFLRKIPCLLYPHHVFSWEFDSIIFKTSSLEISEQLLGIGKPGLESRFSYRGWKWK